MRIPCAEEKVVIKASSSYILTNYCCRYSILPALSDMGMVALSVYQGTFNLDRFLSFIELLLTRMQPYPNPKSVIVMDNCKIHKDPCILNAITDV